MYKFCSPKAFNGFRRVKKFTMKACAEFYCRQISEKIISKIPAIALLTSKSWYRLFCCCFGPSPSAECLCSTSRFNSSLKLPNLVSWRPGKRTWAQNFEAKRNNLSHLRKMHLTFPSFLEKKNGNYVLRLSTSIAERKYKQTNKLTWACNPRAERSSFLPNQNARFAKAML